MSKLLGGVGHTLPKDMKEALLIDSKLTIVWNSLTPLARNEWICWTTSGKKPETRQHHVVRLLEDLKRGKRRPCCWPGCPHREKSKK